MEILTTHNPPRKRHSTRAALLAMALMTLVGCFDTTTTTAPGGPANNDVNNDAPNNDVNNAPNNDANNAPNNDVNNAPNNDTPNNDPNNTPNNDPGPVCGDGACDTGETPESCQEDCAEADLCVDVTCPRPDAECDGNTLVTFGADGTCVEGECDFSGVTQRTPCGEGQRCGEDSCECDPDQHLTDLGDCGCNGPCNADQLCAGGACQCDPQQHQRDNANCACNGPCDQPGLERCFGGECLCDPQQHQSDNANCGCNGSCSGGSTCVAGTCRQGPPDADNDGIPDVDDNCPTTPNADQADLNANGIGDACEDPCDTLPIPNANCACERLQTGVFVFCDQPSTVEAAEAACLQTSPFATLVRFDESQANNAAKLTDLTSAAPAHIMAPEFWIDLSRSSGTANFRWSTGGEVFATDPRWSTNEPNEPTAVEACVALKFRDVTPPPGDVNRWLDFPCTQSRPFVCQVDPP